MNEKVRNYKIKRDINNEMRMNKRREKEARNKEMKIERSGRN
jgi:hypothetical protein